jgi:DNA-directed RNA polymerase subunit RPC12/RpoP
MNTKHTPGPSRSMYRYVCHACGRKSYSFAEVRYCDHKPLVKATGAAQ